MSQGKSNRRSSEHIGQIDVLNAAGVCRQTKRGGALPPPVCLVLTGGISMRRQYWFRPMVEQLEQRFAPTVTAWWTDNGGNGDGLWTTATNWINDKGLPYVPESAGDYAVLQGTIENGTSIPAPTIPAGPAITISGLATAASFDGKTLTISRIVNVDSDPDTGMVGQINWLLGNIDFTQQSAGINVLNGAQANFGAGKITDSGAAPSTITVNGIAPNGGQSTLTLYQNFSELDANIVVGNLTTATQGLMVVYPTTPGPVVLGGNASITLNAGAQLTLYAPQGTNDSGLVAASWSNIISGAGKGFIVDTVATG
jgi:hypothetical protein